MALPRMPSFSSAKAATRKPLQHDHAPSYALRPTSTVHADDDDESGRCSRPLKSDDALDGEDLGSGDDDANDEASELSDLEKEVSLEITLERIGMGRYQWRLLFLCGFGWLCDNMYLTTLAVILPRVADEFSLAPKTIATLSSAMMCGMMVGALSWGCSADLLGRTIPFNMTLALTGIFGVLCSYAQSFGTLRLGIFFLGTAVGGSMPTDGTIFLENTPKRSQYLLTGLSVFFSLGATVTSILALSIIPANSCPEGLTASSCDVATQNLGWRWLLRILGLLTLLMCIARLFLFRLHESPRFLVNEGRADEALAVLRRIVAFNDRRLSLDLEDVGGESRASSAFTHTPVRNSLPSPAASPQSPPPRRDHSPSAGAAQDLDYGTSSQATSRPAESFPFRTPTMEQTHNLMLNLQESVDDDDEIRRLTPIGRPSSRPSLRHSWMDDQRRSNHHPYPRSEESTEGINRTSGRLFNALTSKIGEIFTPKWRRTTVLMWLIWGATSLAYTMFNAFLPILLEQRVDPASTKGGRTESLEELLLYSLAGCPGALLGAYLIERPTLGRRKTLALLTLATALATLAFSGVTSKAGVIVSSMAISLAGTAMYSVLYGMSPEMYSTSIRGTATGSAAAISRLTGIAAPLLTGFLLPIGPSLALWVSASVFGLSAVCASLLPFERAEDVEDAAASLGEGE